MKLIKGKSYKIIGSLYIEKTPRKLSSYGRDIIRYLSIGVLYILDEGTRDKVVNDSNGYFWLNIKVLTNLGELGYLSGYEDFFKERFARI